MSNEKMQHLLELWQANKIWIIPMLSWLALDLANGLKKYPGASSRFLWLHGLLDRLSVHSNADAPGTFKMPLKRSKRPGSTGGASGRIPAAAALLPFLFLASSCQCFKAETRNTPACAILNQIIDCTTDAVLSNLGPSVVAMIRTFVADPNQTPNWEGLTDALIAAGIKDGGCIIAQLQADFLKLNKPSADPVMMAARKSAANALARFKQKNGISNVRYKVKVAGEEVLL